MLQSTNQWRLAALAVVALCLHMFAAPRVMAQAGTIRFVPESEPTVLDPVTSTITVEQQHAYLIYDTLYGLDANGVPQPQMVAQHNVDASGRMHTFTLRPGLKFNDGTPVTAADAVASVKRWAARDTSVGIKLRENGLNVQVVDTNTFTISTNQPSPLVLIGLAKIATPALFVMRERDAANEPTAPVKARIGSGPFRFVASEYKPGAQLVYERNPDYVPRDEPPSYFAGGKRVYVERVVTKIIPDPATASAAMQNNEVDILDAPPLDLVPVLRKQPDILVRPLDQGGVMGVLRPNHLHFPFNDARGRQALMASVDQAQFMPAVGGEEPGGWRECFSFLGCGTAQVTQAGMDRFRHADPALAKRLLAEINYHNEPIVLMLPADSPVAGPLTQIAAQSMRAAGFNVDLQTTDWATMLQRRGKSVSDAEGGWDLFITWAYSFDTRSPATNFLLGAPCTPSGWFGWACDPAMEQLRTAWSQQVDDGKRWELFQQIQARAAETIPYVPLGEFLKQVAWRKSVSGLMETPITVFWNARKN